MTRVADLHRRWSKDPRYVSAYEALGEEFELTARRGRIVPPRQRTRQVGCMVRRGRARLGPRP